MSAGQDVKRDPTLDDLRARRGEIMEAARRNRATAVWVFGAVAEDRRLRNLLVHSYFNVEPEVVWAVVAGEVPR